MLTRVAIVTLGCARNEVDSEELAARLSKDGIELVQEPSDADAVFVNTCGFIEAAKKDSIDTLLAANDLKECQRKHKELRESHLEGLAEAIVLEQAPTLIFDSVAHIKEERKLQKIQQLIKREKLNKTYRKIYTYYGMQKKNIIKILW